MPPIRKGRFSRNDPIRKSPLEFDYRILLSQLCPRRLNSRLTGFILMAALALDLKPNILMNQLIIDPSPL